MITRRSITLVGLLAICALAGCALAGCRCGDKAKPAAPRPGLDAGPAPTPARRALLMEQRGALDEAWLAAELKHTDPARRGRAALAVGRTGGSAADARRIIPLLADSAPPVRRQAAFALGLLARRSVGGAPLKALGARLLIERDPGVRRRITAAVRQAERASSVRPAAPPEQPLEQLEAALRDWRPPVQVQAIPGLARTTAGALRLVTRLPRMWRSVSSNHFRLTGPQLHPVMVALKALRPHARQPQVRRFAEEMLDLTDATDAAVNYGAKEALSVDRVHCAVAALHDLAAGKLERTPRCGTAGSKLLTPAMRRAFVARLIPELRLAPAKRLSLLRPHLEDADASVRRAASAQLHRLGLATATLTTEMQRALAREPPPPEVTPPAAPPWLRDLPPLSRLPRRAQVVFSKGVVTLALLPGETPAAVARLAWLAKQKAYHRTRVQQVRPFETILGADPRAVGRPALPPARNEPTPRPIVRGSVVFEALRRGLDGPGLVFVLTPSPSLDGARTQLGQVTEGFEVLERLQPGDPIKAVYVFWPEAKKKGKQRTSPKSPKK